MARRKDNTIKETAKAIDRVVDIINIDETLSNSSSILLKYPEAELKYIYSLYARGYSQYKILSLYKERYTERKTSAGTLKKILDALIDESNTQNQTVISVRNSILQGTYVSLLESVEANDGLASVVNEKIREWLEIVDIRDMQLRDLVLLESAIRDRQMKILEFELKMEDLNIKREVANLDEPNTNVQIVMDMSGFTGKPKESEELGSTEDTGSE